MKNLKFLLVMSVLAFSLAFISCDDRQPTADEKDQAQQEQLLRDAQRETGMPAVPNHQEKKMLKMIYELRDNNKLINYAYLYNEMQGKLVFLGKCIGFAMPYATQYSNPQKLDWHQAGGYVSMPQAEPNGLFMPSAAEGTWVMLLDSKGDPHPVYLEPRVIVSPFPLSLNQ